jgi:hypothetical protein
MFVARVISSCLPLLAITHNSQADSLWRALNAPSSAEGSHAADQLSLSDVLTKTKYCSGVGCVVTVGGAPPPPPPPPRRRGDQQTKPHSYRVIRVTVMARNETISPKSLLPTTHHSSTGALTKLRTQRGRSSRIHRVTQPSRRITCGSTLRRWRLGCSCFGHRVASLTG